MNSAAKYMFKVKMKIPNNCAERIRLPVKVNWIRYDVIIATLNQIQKQSPGSSQVKLPRY